MFAPLELVEMSGSYAQAVRVRIREILEGEFEEAALNAARLLRPPPLLGVSISVNRVRVIGMVTGSMISEDRRYGRLTLEDGTGRITVRVWDEEVEMIIDPDTGDLYESGTLLEVIAQVRAYKGEKYLHPSLVIKLKDPNWLIVGNLELMRRVLKPIITMLRSSSSEFGS